MEEFKDCSRADLVALILGLKHALDQGAIELASTREMFNDCVNERDAALLLNELCHY